MKKKRVAPKSYPLFFFAKTGMEQELIVSLCFIFQPDTPCVIREVFAGIFDVSNSFLRPEDDIRLILQSFSMWSMATGLAPP